MSETVNIVCYKWKTLSNGEHPLMLCICKDRKRKYQSIGVSINPIYWDFEKNKPKPKCPNRAYICKLISEKLSSVNTEIIRLHSENKDFTAKSVVDSHRKSHKSTTVEAVFNQFIKRVCRCLHIHKASERKINEVNKVRKLCFGVPEMFSASQNYLPVSNLQSRRGLASSNLDIGLYGNKKYRYIYVLNHK
jgi:hypothetical protein